MKTCLLPVLGLVLTLGLPAGAAADQNLSLRLFVATAQGDAAAISRLLAAGADPDDKVTWLGITPLHIAAKLGHVVAIDALLAGGADPNAKTHDSYVYSLRRTDEFTASEVTPLYIAAARATMRPLSLCSAEEQIPM